MRCRVAWNQDVHHLCGLDGLGEVCVEHILPKTVDIRKSILCLGTVYTFVRQRNASVERIILLDDDLGRKSLMEIIAYFLYLIQEFRKLVSFRYNLPESSVRWISPFRLIFVLSCRGGKFHSGNMESGRVFGA